MEKYKNYSPTPNTTGKEMIVVPRRLLVRNSGIPDRDWTTGIECTAEYWANTWEDE